MAIYSLRMTAVGKTTQKQPFTAAAHLKYITRKEAVTQVMAARMPDVRRQAIAWLKREERDDRKNARVIDKLVLALPLELSSVHQSALIKAFAEELTQGRASWFAAFHTKGKDRANPHCHLVLRDRDFETGRRVMFLSAGKKEQAERREKGKSQPTTLLMIRALWEQCANAALEVAGRAERIDRRSLREQGVGRRPQVHEGPNIRAMHRRGVRPRSRDRVVRNSPFRRGKRSGSRVVRYPVIDRGVTRVEYNLALKQTARAAAVRAPQRVAVAPAVMMPVIIPARLPTPVYQTALGNPAIAPNLRRFPPWPATAAGSTSTGGMVEATLPAALSSHHVAPTPSFVGVSTGDQPPPPSPRVLTLTELFALEHGTAAAQPRSDRDRDKGRDR
jgi:MobA/MobL family